MSSSLRPGQAILDCLTLEEGIGRFLRNVSNYNSALCNTPEERRSYLNSGGSLQSHEDQNCIHRHDRRSFKLLWCVRNRIRDKRPGVRIPLEARDFLLLPDAQTDCGVHSPSYSVDAGVRFQGTSSRGQKLTITQSSVEVRYEWSYTSSHVYILAVWTWEILLIILTELEPNYLTIYTEWDVGCKTDNRVSNLGITFTRPSAGTRAILCENFVAFSYPST